MSWKHAAAAMLSALAVCGVALETLAQPAGAATELRFRPGTGRLVVNGRLRGGEARRYTVRARAGQTLRVILTRQNHALTFNVVRPGGAVIVDGAALPNPWAATRLPIDGVYRIDVFLGAPGTPPTPYRMVVAVDD